MWEGRDKVVVRVLTVMGLRDHYAHFLLDFVIPLWMWLNQNGLENREDFTVYYWDGSIEKFRGIIDAFFKCKVMHVSLLKEPLNVEKVLLLGMESHNRRLMHVGLEHYHSNPKRLLSDLHEYTFKKLPVDILPVPNKIVQVKREKTGENRGADRRSTANEDKLSEELQDLAKEKGLEFEEVFLAGKRFATQVELFANAKVVVAQHGAALVNLFWMRKGSILFEYHWNNNEEYRKRQFCEFLGQPEHLHMEGLEVEPKMVEAPVGAIVGLLRAKL